VIPTPFFLLLTVLFDPSFRALKPSAFADLPPAIASVLRARDCLIPQPGPDGAHNVIRGEFFAKGQTAWAVLCAAGGNSAILVFRGASDSHPAEVEKSSDEIYIEKTGAGVWYGRQLRAVGRKFIVDHYDALGGPRPPPIDHQGIDDEFLEKASVVHYWYRGQWLRLTGAD